MYGYDGEKETRVKKIDIAIMQRPLRRGIPIKLIL